MVSVSSIANLILPPEAALSAVVLPQPDGPTMQTISPRRTAKLSLPRINGLCGRWWATTDDDEHYVYAIAL